MKLETIDRPSLMNGTLSQDHFGISTNDQANIITILRDRLYSDKILAILREYSTNAIDAHVEAGCPEKQIHVTLPTEWSPFLKIRDFGPGLSREGIYDTYVKYGRSTKRESNDAIGQLGLGSKSAFAYSDNFTITTWHGGHKLIFKAFIDETNLGKIVELADIVTGTDETGIEISIPTRATDNNVFKDRAAKLFQHFKVKPKINITIPTLEKVLEGENWYLGKDANGTRIGPLAIMGNIAYPINTTVLDKLPRNLKSLLEAGLCLEVGIGDVTMSASRESLEYLPHTIKTLWVRTERALDEIMKSIDREWESATNQWEAYLAFLSIQDKLWNITSRSSGYSYSQSRIEVPNKYLSWNGNPLPINSRYKPLTGINSRIYETGRVTPSKYPERVAITKDTRFVLADTQFAANLRLKTIKEQGKTLFILDSCDEADMVKWLELLNCRGAPYTKLSNIQYTKAGKTQARTSEQLEKLKSTCFQLDRSKILSSLRAPSDRFDTVTIEDDQVEERIYVPIVRFYMENHSDYSELNSRLQVLSILDSKYSSIVLYGIRKEEVKNLGTNWIDFSTYFERELTLLMHQNNLRTVCFRLNEILTGGLDRNLEVARKLIPSLIAEDCGHLLVQYIRETDEVLSFSQRFTNIKGNYSIYTFLAWLNTKERSDVSTLDSKRKEILKLYPMLDTCGILSKWHPPVTEVTPWQDTIVSYIKSIDQKEK